MTDYTNPILSARENEVVPEKYLSVKEAYDAKSTYLNCDESQTQQHFMWPMSNTGNKLP